MYILPINANQNNNTTFGTVKYGRKNPGINNEVRKLAEKASDMFDRFAGRSINLDSSTSELAEVGKEQAVLSRVIDGNNVELILSGRNNTKLNLFIDRNNEGRVYRELEYNPNARYDMRVCVEELRSTPHISGENLNSFDIESLRYARELNGYPSFAELNSTFVRYVKPIIESAERI